MGHPVQFTPWGMVNHLGAVEGPPTVSETVDQAPAVVEKSATLTKFAVQPIPDPRPDVKLSAKDLAASAAAGGSPRMVINLAKGRARAIRAELKRMKALQKELAELERLLTAAKRPVASVSQITRRSSGA